MLEIGRILFAPSSNLSASSNFGVKVICSYHIGNDRTATVVVAIMVTCDSIGRRRHCSTTGLREEVVAVVVVKGTVAVAF